MDSSPIPPNGDGVSAESTTATSELEPIAVVGIALKFPNDADTPESFWRLLLEGRSTVTEVPKSRWNSNRFYHPDPARNDAVRTHTSRTNASS
jgi:acyl transferase domain-containing protein